MIHTSPRIQTTHPPAWRDGLTIFCAFLASLCFLLHDWLIWITPYWGDDLWHRSEVRSRNLFSILSQPIFGDLHHGPLYHLWIWCLSLLPSHSSLMDALSILLLACTCILVLKLWHLWGITPAHQALGLFVLLSMPTLGQGLYWQCTIHLWLSLIWILLAIYQFSGPEPQRTKALLGIAWLCCALLTSEMSYGFVGIALLGCLFFRSHLQLKKIDLCIGMAVATAFLLWRNYLITGHVWQIARPNPMPPRTPTEFYQDWLTLWLYSEPWGTSWAAWPGQYLVNPSFSHLLMFLVLTLNFVQWGFLLLQKNKAANLLCALYFSTTVAILWGNLVLKERYLSYLIFANILSLPLLLKYLQQHIRLKLQLGVIVLLMLGLLNSKVLAETSWRDWAQNSLHYRRLEQYLQDHPATVKTPIALVDGFSADSKNLPQNKWQAAIVFNLNDLQMNLEERGQFPCVYDLRSHGTIASTEQQQWAINALKQHCAWPPTSLKCFRFTEGGGDLPFKAVYGDFELQDLDQQRQISKIIVHCE